MLKLAVVAPDKRKVELELEPSTTFQQVKARLEERLGVPADKQRLLCGGKERKNGAETLAAAKVADKSKVMLLLVPGYTMPPPRDAPAVTADAAPEAPTEAAAEPEALDLEGELPLAAGAAETEGAPEGAPAVVHVRHGPHRYHVRVRQGLARATFGELAEYLAVRMLPRGIPASELHMICRGKTPDGADALSPAGGRDMTVMLLFREGFHAANEGASWLSEQSQKLASAEAEMEKLGRRIEANFEDGGETSVRLAEVTGLVEMLEQSLESVRVSEAKLPEMLAFRDRVLAAAERLRTLRKGVRL